ncbi:Uncharacterised protein [Vibrio cholerae]|nr:Uncharacterised protein [Vibrio cholerae]CSB36420.1 Uncharacterised protein [Vibrio cholerae]
MFELLGFALRNLSHPFAVIRHTTALAAELCRQDHFKAGFIEQGEGDFRQWALIGRACLLTHIAAGTGGKVNHFFVTARQIFDSEFQRVSVCLRHFRHPQRGFAFA